MHPDELLEQLKVTSNSRKQKTLDIVHAVCREQWKRGSRDFSVATIAKIAHERGGPTKGSIHNKTGDDFKALIKAWAEHTGGVTRKERKVSENPYVALVEKIENPAIRAVMASVLAENRKLRRERDLLKANTNLVIDIRHHEASNASGPIQILPASTGLTEIEKEALREAISNKFLDGEGWASDTRGRVVNDKGRQLYKVGYVSAILKIVGDEKYGASSLE